MTEIIHAQPVEVVYKMPASRYHSDEDGPRLSASLAKLVAQKSALHAYAACPTLGGAPYVYEPDTSDGTLIHSLVLEPDSAAIEEIDESLILTKDGSVAKVPLATAEGKAAVAIALLAGRIPVLSKKLNAMKYIAKAVRHRFASHPTRPIEFTGHSEVVIYWTETVNGQAVPCRCRIDHLRKKDGRMVITDLKSAESASSDDIGNACWRYGYDIQEAVYRRAVSVAFPAFAGRIDFEFAFLELERPFAVNPVTLSGKFRRMGERRWQRALETWARCLAEDDWSGYMGGTIAPPKWAESKELGAFDDDE